MINMEMTTLQASHSAAALLAVDTEHTNHFAPQDKTDVIVNIDQNAELPQTEQSASSFCGRTVAKLKRHCRNAILYHKSILVITMSFGSGILGFALGCVASSMENRSVVPAESEQRIPPFVEGFIVGEMLGLGVSYLLTQPLAYSIENSEAQKYSQTVADMREIRKSVKQITGKKIEELYLQLPVSREQVAPDDECVILYEPANELVYPIKYKKQVYDFIALLLAAQNNHVIPHTGEQIENFKDLLCDINNQATRIDFT